MDSFGTTLKLSTALMKSEKLFMDANTAVRYLPTWLYFSKVVEKKEENVVFNRSHAALSTNPILIH